jgi:hypothetical protein
VQIKSDQDHHQKLGVAIIWANYPEKKFSKMGLHFLETTRSLASKHKKRIYSKSLNVKLTE